MNLLKYEQELLKQGYKVICGVDEVGYSPCAGPLVACAIVMELPRAKKIHFRKFKINDSKQIPKEIRTILFKRILRAAFAVGIGRVEVDEINKIGNIRKCGYLARYRAVQCLGRSSNLHTHIYWHYKDQNLEYAMKFHLLYTPIVPGIILVDGNFGMPEVKDIPVKSIVGGDAKSISIASASIVAKVYRDTYMNALHTLYPMYGFNTNVGYGTKFHVEALKKYGPTPYHRTHFKFVKESNQQELFEKEKV
jgi:ribonuclease HII